MILSMARATPDRLVRHVCNGRDGARRDPQSDDTIVTSAFCHAPVALAKWVALGVDRPSAYTTVE